MFDAFFDAIAAVLAWFYELPILGGSYAMAIVLLTLTVMIILTPLTLKGTRSMMAMQALQPEMKRIQQEFKDDRQRMNEELLAFYKENQINPLGGCLPLLLQMPVFIVLFQVLNGLTRVGDDGNFDPKYLDQSSELYQSLSNTDEMVSWGIDLSQSAVTALGASFLQGLPYLVLIIFVAGTSYLQQKQISGRNPNIEMPAQQKMLLRIMPVFFAFISFNFAAGLVLYFLVSNVYRILQQGYISRSLYNIKGRAMFFGGVAGAPAIATTATEVDDRPAARPEKSTGGGGGSTTPSKGNGGGKTPPKKSSGGGRTTPPKKPSATGRTTPPKRPTSGGRATPPSRGDGPGATPPRRRKKRS
ncbi:MAG TPA: membrane protein insertase YidC [Acidimicrobiales bacterium]|nr:membrane protein insertase YidC [Acidimicrobiales bacterium]